MSSSSVWELAAGQPSARRDLRREAWGFDWGTLLGPLGADPQSVTHVQVRPLRDVLLPVLPSAGTRPSDNQVAPTSQPPPPFLA